MTLRQKQSRFVHLITRLLVYIDAAGFEVTFGETYRSPEEAARLAQLGKGIVRSLHTQRLAIDLNLFLNGRYLNSTEAHRPFGEWWEQQSEPGIECCWGGRFARVDGNHYSVAHNGRQ